MRLNVGAPRSVVVRALEQLYDALRRRGDRTAGRSGRMHSFQTE